MRNNRPPRRKSNHGTPSPHTPKFNVDGLGGVQLLRKVGVYFTRQKPPIKQSTLKFGERGQTSDTIALLGEMGDYFTHTGYKFYTCLVPLSITRPSPYHTELPRAWPADYRVTQHNVGQDTSLTKQPLPNAVPMRTALHCASRDKREQGREASNRQSGVL